LPNLVRVGEIAAIEGLADAGEHRLRRRHAHVAREQHFFDLVRNLGADLASPDEDRAQSTEEPFLAPRAREAATQALELARRWRRHGRPERLRALRLGCDSRCRFDTRRALCDDLIPRRWGNARRRLLLDLLGLLGRASRRDARLELAFGLSLRHFGRGATLLAKEESVRADEKDERDKDVNDEIEIHRFSSGRRCGTIGTRACARQPLQAGAPRTEAARIAVMEGT